MHPEPAFKETRTAGIAAERLAALGMRVTTGLGVTGVVAVLEGAAPGKTVMLRTDMDGVEQQDETPGREYGSTVPTLNHSCGHDIDMTVFLGAAALIAARRGEFSGRVVFVAQPADEPRTGAAAMIKDGLWDLIQPDYLLTHHVAPDVDAGKIVAHGGELWGSYDLITVRVRREDATPPHVTLVASKIVEAIYAAVEGEIAAAKYPPNFAVAELSASQPRRGVAEGRIDLRYVGMEIDVRERILAKVRDAAETTAAGLCASIEIEVEEATKPIVNDVRVAEAVSSSVLQLYGEGALDSDTRHPVFDDFSLLQEQAPGAMVLLGTRNEAKGITAMWHTPEYDCDEDALSVGAAVMAASVLKLLEE
jgi:amidohydrolase